MATYEDLLKKGYTSEYQKQIEDAQKNRPTYVSGRETQLNDLYNQISTRKPFTYDLNGDALYQQYKDQYQTLGKQAMKDTMGQAAGLTGGYGSTYSQSVGQQAYNAYLQRLNDVVPDLYNSAYGRYNQETQDLYNLYGLNRDLENQDYNRYKDDLSNYWDNLSYLQNQDNTAYNRYMDNLSVLQKQDDTAYSRQQDYYSRLVNLMTQTGYKPTDEDLAAAGMTRAQADSYLGYYAQSQASGGGSGGGGGGRSYSGGRSSGGGYVGSTGSTASSGATRPSTQAELEAAAPFSVGGTNGTNGQAMTHSEAYQQVMNGAKVSVSQFTDPTTGRVYYHNNKTGENYASTPGYPVTQQMAEYYARQSVAKGLMSQTEWNKNKKGYSTYTEYLKAYIKWATS